MQFLFNSEVKQSPRHIIPIMVYISLVVLAITRLCCLVLPLVQLGSIFISKRRGPVPQGEPQTPPKPHRCPGAWQHISDLDKKHIANTGMYRYLVPGVKNVPSSLRFGGDMLHG